ncbi:MAG: hypothetical protein CMM94_03240 [Rickettsiales bacterium]|nr:hypothetical protein [Rickettsiales bacterium]
MFGGVCPAYHSPHSPPTKHLRSQAFSPTYTPMKPDDTQRITISAFYHFAPLDDTQSLRAPLREFMETHGIKGTIILAPEGVNGTVSGSDEAIAKLRERLRSIPGMEGLQDKVSYFHRQPFQRTKVKLKNWLIPFEEKVDPVNACGTYVEPKDWNDLISDPDVVTIDTRNDYEVHIGKFKHAVNPGTDVFREIIPFTKEQLDQASNKKVAMYCTGGIRCEKYSAYLRQQGFEEVYHLKGGILQYLQDMPAEQSLWEGDCFVFDERVAVGHGVQPNEEIIMCLGCGHPLTAADREHEAYEEGECCAFCAK